MEWKWCFIQLEPSFYNKLSGLMVKWRELHVLQLVKSFANVFVSCNILKDKLIWCRLDKWLVNAMDWDVAELPGMGVVISDKAQLVQVRRGRPQGLTLGPVLFNIFLKTWRMQERTPQQVWRWYRTRRIMHQVGLLPLKQTGETDWQELREVQQRGMSETSRQYRLCAYWLESSLVEKVKGSCRISSWT